MRISMKPILALVLALLILPGIVSAQYPTARGFVNDFAGVMQQSTVTSLERVLRELEQKSGAQVAVVTVPDLGGETIETYAVGLMQAWGIGRAGENDGVLILVAVQERRLRIEVGYGLEDVITDARAGQIRDRYMTPALRNDNYDEGIRGGALAVAAIIAEARGVTLTGNVAVPQPVDTTGRSQGRGSFLRLLIFIIIIFLLIGGRRGRGGFGGLLTGMMLGSMMGGGFGGRRHYGGFGGGFGGGGGGFGGFGGGFSGGGGASGGF